MISATNLSMRFGGKILFDEASFQLLPNKHYGLVGPNGSGKSTLLKLMTAEIIPEKGDLSMPSATVIGALKQDHFFYDAVPIRDVVMMGKPRLWQALHQKEELLGHHPFTEEDCKLLGDCEKVIEELHGYAASSQASQILEGLGIPSKIHERPMNTLSGGYKLRVLLAQLLFSSPDVLLLDEPTNHLDIFSIRWLEQYLQTFPGTLVLCSHDRQFLNAVCDHIIDIDYGTITIFKGTYDQFEVKKSELRLLKESQIEKQEKKIEEMQAFVDRFKAKATKAAQAQSKMKAIDKLESTMEKDLPASTRKAPNISFDICRPSGAVALKIKSLGKSYGEKLVLHDVTLEIERGEKVAFLGANGIGKSTLLEILVGNTPLSNGTFEWGHAVQTAYFPQDHSRVVSGKESLLDWLSHADPQAPREVLQRILGRALFSGDDAEKSVAILSGGETARLVLSKMMLIKHNVLIFDEPTNHLDIEATDALIKSLQDYPGTILFVSHNRHFIGKVATRIIEMGKEGILDFKCPYGEYIAKRDLDLLDAAKAMRMSSDNIPKGTQTGKKEFFDQKEQKRLKEQLQRKLEAAEKRCHQLEIAIKEIDQKLCSDGFYQNTPKAEQEKLFQEKEKKEQELHKALEEWEKLGENLQ